MNYKINSLPILLLLSTFIFACEYERIASPETDCGSNSLELIIESVQNTTCQEASGEIVASVNGDAVYEFRLNEGDFVANSVFTGLAAGTYTIQARNINSNCVSEEMEANVRNEGGLQLSVVETKDSNCGTSSGSILISQVGGVEPIDYVLNGDQSQTEPEFTGLSNGSYTIVARDANGCEAEISEIEIRSGISFSNDIKSIITTNCAVSGCHNGSQPPNFSTDDNIFVNASRIKTRTSAGTMPPAGRPDLTEDEIQAIACWVDDGALDN
ncbi:hypothetical protein SAMN05661096_03507 [Marivirga sericea]|uniref:SprB repeat-containing protein n=1 Tax=Marivirga sericea TaxID=1028 RepID=A0A1X7L498_9BACT|nr:hypothetical protein [Marivirga sericea]SMG48708.1 hypothetical protein SAMN05661096_03507 [Marivirga sericea]